jgi:hypothetical protein
MERYTDNERRLIKANTKLVDKNTLLLKDIKLLIRYIKKPNSVDEEEVNNMIAYYDNFSTNQG